MARYIEISRARLANILSKLVGEDALSFIELSPYDAPVAMTGRFDRHAGKFWISFQYIDDEPATQITEENGIEMFVGKHSRKLLWLAISVERTLIDAAAITCWQTKVLALLNKIQMCDETMIHEQKRFRLNWSLARQLLIENFTELTDELVTAGRSSE